jgi:hypothetical protein
MKRKKGYSMKLGSMTRITMLAVAIAALVSLAARPSAAAITTNSTTQYTNPFINPCNGHAMVSMGFFHTVASTTFDSAGFQTRFHLNEEQARDLDTVTGEVCTDTANENEHSLNYDFVSGTVGGLPIVIGVTFTGLVTCPHQAGSNIYRVYAEVVVNPNGTVVLNRTNFPPGDLRCK